MQLMAIASPWVLPHVQGCPEPLMEHHIREAARRYFRESSAWVWMDEGQTTTKGQREYEIETGVAGADVVRVDTLWLDEQVLPPTKVGRDGFYVKQPGNIIELSVDPVDGQWLKMRLILMPSRTAVNVPDEVMEPAISAIAHGAIATLMLLPGVAWADAGLASYHAGEFMSAIAEARLVSVKERVDRPLFVHKARFG